MVLVQVKDILVAVVVEQILVSVVLVVVVIHLVLLRQTRRNPLLILPVVVELLVGLNRELKVGLE